jgi:dihydroorotase
MDSFILNNVKIYNKSGQFHIYIKNGNIDKISKNSIIYPKLNQFECKGLLLFPGIFDLYGKIGNPGENFFSFFSNQMSSASAGGFTDILCHPNTEPFIDEPFVVHTLIANARQFKGPKVYPVGALTKKLKAEKISEMSLLSKAGCLCFGNADEPISNYDVLFNALKYAKSLNLFVIIHPCDFDFSKGRFINEGTKSLRLGLLGNDYLSETIPLSIIIQMIEKLNIKIHFTKISSAKGIYILNSAKNKGLPVTYDVSINNLLLNDTVIEDFDTNANLIPPVRSESDQMAIINELIQYVDVICSDNNAISDEFKVLPFVESTPGATSFEVFFSLLYNFFKTNKLNIDSLIDKIAHNPRKIFNLDEAEIIESRVANFFLFDPDHQWSYSINNVESIAVNSPFKQKKIKGKIKLTISNGKITYNKL